MKRFAVSLLTFVLAIIMITEFSSALVIQSHSKQVQTNNEEDTLEFGIKSTFCLFLTISFRFYLAAGNNL